MVIANSGPMLRTLILAFILPAVIILFGGPLLVYALISGRTDTLYAAAILVARVALWVVGVRIEVEGREKIPAGQTVVFLCNHQSNVDAPSVLAQLPPALVIAKQEFFRVAILGRAMRLRGFIPVDRGSRERARGAMRKAVESLKAGNSFLVFPEGTRSLDGRLQEFKKEVFAIAIEAAATIVPVSISGTRQILPKGEFRLRPGRVRITLHEPVPTRGPTESDLLFIMQTVRSAIASGLAQQELPSSTEAENASSHPPERAYIQHHRKFCVQECARPARK